MLVGYEETDLIENKAKYDSVYYLIKTVEKEIIIFICKLLFC